MAVLCAQRTHPPEQNRRARQRQLPFFPCPADLAALCHRPRRSQSPPDGSPYPGYWQSSRKGFILGDAFYLAPKPWMDATIGAQFMSRRGVLERGEFRAKPFENTSITYTYFGVDDRGLVNPDGTRSPQGGEQQRVEIQSLLPGGWRFVTDYNQLSSLTFRLAFADSFGEAVNSEVRSAIFLTNN